ncbi:SUPPRESSOR OF GAMMA RESPONSE 1 isoform X2 [Dendrobium catenatum]|uniref:SUPPRESSOR OF GAMMA RESPONSE 1 isoform X2 n=1 Tax=Dendrobium catenatum TaxID=906689 RepID=UPI0009F60F44|nr:SUPPRESSOR OF GAMMA RESPONSE 1 isoform X2 [Dendrobium catenatum]
MARAWLINSRGIAKKVKNAALYSNYQIRDLGTEANRECPNCKYVIDNSDVSLDWPGLPAGVKFDPTDVELLEHLAGNVGAGMSKAHIFIDEFIPTLDGDQGICYTHPENLPGVKKDGSSAHFFHRTSNAYATGCKKRRKIRNEYSESEERVRWHKTGKTKPVVESGVLKGWKKIMVLYRSLGKGCKPDKDNWVMHQYHLGTNEDEKDGELVVSKVFYQQHTKHVGSGEAEILPDELDSSNIKNCPRTPKTTAPQPPRFKMNSLREADQHDHLPLPVQEKRPEEESMPSPFPIICLKDEHNGSACWADESQAIQEPETEKIYESLLCHEVLFPFTSIGGSSPQFDHLEIADGNKEQLKRDANTDDGFSCLEDIDIDTPSDFHLSMRNLGSLNQFLGIHAVKTNSGILLHQQHYAKAIVERAGMTQSKPVSTPIACKITTSSTSQEPFSNPQLYRHIIGSLQYLTPTRPDIQFAVHQLCQHMQHPLNQHFDALKRLLRFINGTTNTGIQFHSQDLTLRGYVDADWASNSLDRKSISGHCHFMGNSLISWQVKKQNTIARSSTEAEYRALAFATAEIIWLRQLLEDFHIPQTNPTVIYCDNTSAIALANNPVFYARTKHIEVDCHFIREHIRNKIITVHHICSADQLADFFTKALPTTRFQLMANKLTAALQPQV